ncbi:hypothetical protein [Capnocytophaga canimorsus]|uniref:hypothetical protein n=1 Tax=Capnocytophaga canimorsus TaxID=28188 RepID=UPI0028F0708C|nr:hypothetical protein [Capnocytophaga canimorsus]MDT9500399.1 hypothetical protein [Capnocytophaga canimorsus]
MTAIPSNTNQVNHRRLIIDVKGKGQHGTLNDMVIPNSDFAVGKNIFEFSLPEGVNYIDVDRFFLPKESSMNFKFKGFKLVHVNSRGKSVVLIDVLNFAETQFDSFEVFNAASFSASYIPYLVNGINLGFFRIKRGDRIFIEIEVLNANLTENQVFSFSSCCNTSLVPHYDLCRFYSLLKGQTHTLKRKDFDAVISDSVGTNLKVNGFEVVFPLRTDSHYIGEILNADVSLSCGNEAFVIEGVNDNRPNSFLTKKQVHNADTFYLMQEYVKRAKNLLMEKSTTDYSNTIFKQLYGVLPNVEYFNTMIETYSNLPFNESTFGYHDAYEIPVYVEPNNLIS